MNRLILLTPSFSAPATAANQHKSIFLFKKMWEQLDSCNPNLSRVSPAPIKPTNLEVWKSTNQSGIHSTACWHQVWHSWDHLHQLTHRSHPELLGDVIGQNSRWNPLGIPDFCKFWNLCWKRWEQDCTNVKKYEVGIKTLIYIYIYSFSNIFVATKTRTMSMHVHAVIWRQRWDCGWLLTTWYLQFPSYP